MTALSDVAAIVIAAVIVFAVVVLGLTALARRGRQVHVSIDVGEPSDDTDDEAAP